MTIGSQVARWSIAVAAALVALLIVFVLMRFAISFSINMCYSGTLKSLATVSEHIVTSRNETLRAKYLEFLKALPLHGYETNCNEVEASIKDFSKRNGLPSE